MWSSYYNILVGSSERVTWNPHEPRYASMLEPADRHV